MRGLIGRVTISALAIVLASLALGSVGGAQARGLIASEVDGNCAIKLSGQAVCWGSAPLGNGFPDPSYGPVPVKSLKDAIAISGSCAIRKSGQVVCWGYNGHLSPTPVTGLPDAIDISNNCAIRRSGQMVCWGDDVGLPDKRPKLEPVPGLGDVKDISVGDNVTCAIRESGQVMCWGVNPGSGAEDPDANDYPVPTPVAGVGDAIQVDATGQERACAVRESGSVTCWGDDPLVDIEDTYGPAPVAGLTDAKEVALGYNYACALKRSGQVACWGQNQVGQFGNGTKKKSFTPTPAKGLDDAKSLSITGYATCAVRETGQVLCWGYDTFSLGEGTRDKHSLPTQVLAAAPKALDYKVRPKKKSLNPGQSFKVKVKVKNPLIFGVNVKVCAKGSKKSLKIGGCDKLKNILNRRNGTATIMVASKPGARRGKAVVKFKLKSKVKQGNPGSGGSGKVRFKSK